METNLSISLIFRIAPNGDQLNMRFVKNMCTVGFHFWCVPWMIMLDHHVTLFLASCFHLVTQHSHLSHANMSWTQQFRW